MFSVCVFLKSTNGSALGYLWQIKVSSPWLCTIFLPTFLWHDSHFHFIYEREVASLTLTKPQGQRCRICTVSLSITSIAMYQYPLHVKIWGFFYVLWSYPWPVHPLLAWFLSLSAPSFCWPVFAKMPVGMKVLDLFFHYCFCVNEAVRFFRFFPLLKKRSGRQLSCTSLGAWWAYQNWYTLIMQELTQPGNLSASPGI